MSNLQPILAFVNQRQQLINATIVALLGIYLIAFAAELFWRLVPEPESPQPVQTSPTTLTTSSSNTNISLSRLKQLNLFGKEQAPAAVENKTVVTDAPETKLNLVLTGVVASTEEDGGAAVIEHRGSQYTYGVGEKIEGTNATLRSVFSDRVIIRNGIRDETLMLDGLDFNEANQRRQQAQRSPAIETPNQRQDRRLSDEALEASQQLREQPASFTDYISISPTQIDGELMGYRLQPGKNPALFQSAGLQAGDVLTQINGLDLTDPQQATEALAELQSAESLQLTVLRENEYLTLYLDLPDPSDDQ